MKIYIKATTDSKLYDYLKRNYNRLKKQYPDITTETLEAMRKVNWVDAVDGEELETFLDFPIDFNQIASIEMYPDNIENNFDSIVEAFKDIEGDFTRAGHIQNISEITFKDGSVEYWGWRPYNYTPWVDMTDFVLNYNI